MVTVRIERFEDMTAIPALNMKAFGRAAEGEIIDKLRRSCPEILSLVADDNGQVAGHILFSPVVIEGEKGRLIGMGLGPMAVLPELQRQGIGAQLIETGLSMLRQRGCSFVVVVGHPDYYPRFGFERASKYPLSCQWDNLPEEAFMVLILDEQRLDDVKGVVRYREEFNAAG